mmetsp:Transcript_33522/g.54336  ORF Transcript_33522/g.54336 Transcript_33522/m.54336 type:complete len:615 (-) Transcript_33522:419-2263(-)|eukprot:CAMPEP_0184673454 /NCGR_PEP_ID=MMETSP0308-20130426/86686_1 /TAXON_ID=38269 /ORGANISM="Gloeochaete witrockiana, Strain SAG 46.84" /LENGTH=614 /DNA_ID=CAMNT_0027120939 /DNA_START=85 /DNA_END=1929 /DNA_ORIENTATION=+
MSSPSLQRHDHFAALSADSHALFLAYYAQLINAKDEFRVVIDAQTGVCSLAQRSLRDLFSSSDSLPLRPVFNLPQETKPTSKFDQTSASVVSTSASALLLRRNVEFPVLRILGAAGVSNAEQPIEEAVAAFATEPLTVGKIRALWLEIAAMCFGFHPTGRLQSLGIRGLRNQELFLGKHSSDPDPRAHGGVGLSGLEQRIWHLNSIIEMLENPSKTIEEKELFFEVVACKRLACLDLPVGTLIPSPYGIYRVDQVFKDQSAVIVCAIPIESKSPASESAPVLMIFRGVEGWAGLMNTMERKIGESGTRNVKDALTKWHCKWPSRKVHIMGSSLGAVHMQRFAADGLNLERIKQITSICSPGIDMDALQQFNTTLSRANLSDLVIIRVIRFLQDSVPAVGGQAHLGYLAPANKAKVFVMYIAPPGVTLADEDDPSPSLSQSVGTFSSTASCISFPPPPRPSSPRPVYPSSSPRQRPLTITSVPDRSDGARSDATSDTTEVLDCPFSFHKESKFWPMNAWRVSKDLRGVHMQLLVDGGYDMLMMTSAEDINFHLFHEKMDWYRCEELRLWLCACMELATGGSNRKRVDESTKAPKSPPNGVKASLPSPQDRSIIVM